ncbi:hypothetical protein BP6252_12320 [Coleophoma cylindrospora]|uniref:Uncharacterized protein n=1 Tax=Coleophoma cylindrospora TaxID=1849047 RepID=A0A3D8QGR6_9HELO|nr:hypothetical protein BP6252_12320 [Coleophoma cylindrospora]
MLVDKTALLLCVGTSLAMPTVPRLEQYHLLQEPFFPQLAELFKTPYLHWPSSSVAAGHTSPHSTKASSSRPGKYRTKNHKSKNKSGQAAVSSSKAHPKTNSKTNTKPPYHKAPSADMALEAGTKEEATTTSALNDLKIITLDPLVPEAPKSEPEAKASVQAVQAHLAAAPPTRPTTSTPIQEPIMQHRKHPLDACLFTPRTPQYTQPQALTSTIPWSTLSTLLLDTTTTMLTTPTHRRRNLMETIHLGPALEVRALENVYLGVTYTRNGIRGRRPAAAKDEVEEEAMEREEKGVLSCLGEAIWMLGEQGMGMLEGSWEVPDGRGRIGFLIWRID